MNVHISITIIYRYISQPYRKHKTLPVEATWEPEATQTHQNCRVEDWKNITSTWILISASPLEDRAWTWPRQHESTDLTFFVSKVQAGGGGIMMWGKFSGPFNTNWASFERHSRLTHLIMASSMIMGHVAKPQRVQRTSVASPVTSSETNRAPLVEILQRDSLHDCTPDRSTAVVLQLCSHWSGVFLTPLWNLCL